MIEKQTSTLGMPWEADFGFVQGVRVADTLYLSGMVSHDNKGNIIGAGDMAAQMRQAYANVATVLTKHGATMENIVEETMYVTDPAAALAVAGDIRRAAFGGNPQATNTLIGIPQLAFPELMIEVKCTARL